MNKLYLLLGFQLFVAPLFAQLPALIKDIAPKGVSVHSPWSGPNKEAVVNGKLLFWQSDGIHGRELWATDGTETGTYMVMDIVPGAEGPNVHGAFKQNDRGVFFAIGSPTQEIWFTDGTPQNTRRLFQENDFYKIAWDPTYNNNSAVAKNYLFVRGFYSKGNINEFYPCVYRLHPDYQHMSPSTALFQALNYNTYSARIDEVCEYKGYVVATVFQYDPNGNMYSLQTIGGTNPGPGIILSADYPFSNLKNVNNHYLAFLQQLPATGELCVNKIDNVTDYNMQPLTPVQNYIYLERENEAGGAKAVGNKLFFYKDLISQSDLWCTDGTADGTRKAPFTGEAWFNGADEDHAVFYVPNYNGGIAKMIKWNGGPTTETFSVNTAFFHNWTKLITYAGRDFLFAGDNAFIRMEDDQHTYKIFGFNPQTSSLQVGWGGDGRYVNPVNNEVMFLGTHDAYNVGVEPFKFPMQIKIWTGDLSTDWHNAGNWQPNGVPACTDDILIPETPTGNYPVIGADASCNNISINYGSVTVNAGVTLAYHGTMSNYGTADGDILKGVLGVYYLDVDGDGYGDPANSVQACAPPVGYVSTSQMEQHITFDALPAFNYGHEKVALTGLSSSGLTVTYTSSNPAVATISENIVTIIAAGSSEITASQSGNESYRPAQDAMQIFTVNKAALTVTAEDKTKRYADPNPEFTLAYSGFKGTDDPADLDIQPGDSTYASTTSDVGKYPIVPTGGNDNNYSFNYVDGTLTIERAILTVTADNNTKTYGDPNPEFTLGYSGFKGTDDAVDLDVQPSDSTYASTTSDVGRYPIVPTGGEDNNYRFNYVDGTLNIEQAVLTVTADNKTKMYGDAVDQLLTISYSGFKGIDGEDDLRIIPTASTTVTSTSGAGTYDIIPAGGDDDNYLLSYVKGIYTVNKLMLTATADDKSRVYGRENPPFTLTYSGFLTGEDATVVDLDPSMLTDAIIDSPPGDYPITLDGGSDNNYDFYLVSGTLTITQQTTPTPGQPTSNCYLTLPGNNSVNVNYYATLASNFVVGAKTYTFEVNTQPDFSGAPNIKQSSSETIEFLLHYNTKYYARVKTDLVPASWSVITAFTTGNPVSLAYITSPEDGATTVPTNVKVTANNVYGATTYTIELNTSADFSGSTITQTSSGRSISFKKLVQATKYYARVSTNLAPGQWGRRTSFTTIDPRARSTGGWEGEDSGDFETQGVSYHVYPNPFRDNLTILVQTLEQGPADIVLFDLNGKMLEQMTANTNNLIVLGQSLSNGVYVLQVVTGEGTKFIRVIKR